VRLPWWGPLSVLGELMTSFIEIFDCVAEENIFVNLATITRIIPGKEKLEKCIIKTNTGEGDIYCYMDRNEVIGAIENAYSPYIYKMET
jgi:hypothetical protein